MRTRQLGRTDLHVSEIVFGGIPILQQEYAQAERVLRAALDEGVNCFDTARGYGDSEAKMGQAFAPDECLIMSKAHTTDGAKMRAELEQTLANLNRDHVDVYAMHQVASAEQLGQCLAPGGALEALRQAKQDGKVRAIGMTGHHRPTLIAAVEQAGDAIDSVMLLFNPLETDALDRLVPLCVERGVGLVAMKAAGAGVWTSQQVLASTKWCLNQPIACANVGFSTVEEVRAVAPLGREDLALTAEDEATLETIRDQYGLGYCRRCGECAPCPKGINIVGTLVGESMVKRLGWEQLGQRNFLESARKARDCDECGLCIERCPWSLNVPALLPDALRRIEALA
jgi:predicted aldo/keto reductase-like oxidoreductase